MNDYYDLFDWETYIKDYIDLERDEIISKSKDKSWEHWNVFGKYENRFYKYLTKKVLIFHVGNIQILENILNKFPSLKEIPVIITYYQDDYTFDKYFKYILLIKKVENKGTDCGPMLLVIKDLLRNLDRFYEDCVFLKIHTKSIEDWRDKLIEDILEEQDFDFKVPFIFGSEKYIFRDIKSINRNYILDILDRNDKEASQNYLDFINHYNFYDGEKNVNVDLIPSENFYKKYEPDLNNLEDPLKHWEEFGKKEFHRISNVNYLKKSARYDNKFVAGTIFGFNKLWIKLFKNFDLNYEYSILEEGYVNNFKATKLHSWEYLFGNYVLLRKGIIYGVEKNIISKTLGFQKINEQKIYSKINQPYHKSNYAFFMILPGDNPNSGGYRTLLKYIKFLNLMGHHCDIYFGICFNNNDIENNVLNLNDDGMPNCKNWINDVSLDKLVKNFDNYGEVNLSKNNFYLGLKCQKKYDVIFANAWQISEAVYLNRHLSKKIIYIIQDREDLFYDNEKLKYQVLQTYHPEFHYYCITKYLEMFFKEIYNLPKVKGSIMGVRLDKYYLKNKERKNAIAIPYYADEKPNRLPRLVEKIIDTLVKNKITCYVFPKNYGKNSKYLINLGTLNEKNLNSLYNSCKVGIIFSTSNPSRLGLEMYSSGLHVIEYDNIFTKYDLPDKYFTKIRDEEGIVSLIKKLFKKKYDDGYRSKIDINSDFKKFYKNIL